MKFWKTITPQVLAVVFLCLAYPAAHAIPKAAEHENAEVAVGADVAKPRATPKSAKKEVRKKTATATATKSKTKAPATTAAKKKAKTVAHKK